MLLLIDNYDSFTFNLLHYVEMQDVAVNVVRNDAITVDAVLADIKKGSITGILISPGPCTPNEAGICLDLVSQLNGAVPLLGVCLGHQTIAQAFGGDIIRADTVMHGKISQIQHDNTGIFKDIPNPFDATRYHSLIAKTQTLPDCLNVTAATEGGVIMGLQHKTLPYHGVQFHPESIASQHGHQLIGNFCKLL